MGVMDLRRGLMMAGVSPGITPFYTGEFEFSTTSTSAIDVGTFNLGPAAYTSDKILLIQIRNKWGKRKDHFYGSDNFIANPNKYRIKGSASGLNVTANLGYRFDANLEPLIIASWYGIYVKTMDDEGVMTLSARFQSSYSRSIEGTWEIKAYLLDFIGENPVSNV